MGEMDGGATAAGRTAHATRTLALLARLSLNATAPHRTAPHLTAHTRPSTPTTLSMRARRWHSEGRHASS